MVEKPTYEELEQKVKELEKELFGFKRIEMELRESEGRFRIIFEAANDCVFLKDRSLRYTQVNPAMERLLELPAQKLIGKNDDELFGEQAGAHIREIDSRVLKGEIIQEEHTKSIGEIPTTFHVVKVPIRDDNGEVTGLCGIARNITERKMAEAALQESEEKYRSLVESTEDSICLLDRNCKYLFMNQKHLSRFGLPIEKVIGSSYSEFHSKKETKEFVKKVNQVFETGRSLSYNYRSERDGPLREEIEAIRKAGENAAALTRQLLAFSRKQIIQPKILGLNELLTEIEKMLGRLIGEDVELLTILEPELWQVEADSGQMDQVIMNLAINAKDAMPKGGKLTIETANAVLNEDYFREHGIEQQSGLYAVLTVSDTGSGMDEETQKQIFDPFFTTKERGKGTGLGLSTVYGIVKQNNGFIWVYSEPGQGSTFKVYLPKVKGDVEEEEKERALVAELDGSETVLIVEDDDSLRKLTRTVLKQRGYKVLEAENGEDALRVSDEHDGMIDLMITDVVMPKMSGQETAERLQPLYPHMKVIYMSGYTDNAIVHHGVLAPGLNFLEKPFTPEGLARKVREVLD